MKDFIRLDGDITSDGLPRLININTIVTVCPKEYGDGTVIKTNLGYFGETIRVKEDFQTIINMIKEAKE